MTKRIARTLRASCAKWAPLLVLMCSPALGAAEEAQNSRMVVDFEDAAAIRLSADGAESAVAKDGRSAALEINTTATGSWPGVLIEPRAGQWDLRGYDMLLMDVRNPQNEPLRVLLSANNPGADGTRHCNSEAVTAPAGGRATLTLPFGVWHGDPGHPIDQSKIVSLRVFLDRPERAARFFVDNIRAVKYDRSAMDKVFADEFFQQLQPPFGRGINLGNALDAPKEGEWGVTLEESYFAAIADAGFDSVRIPVRWSAHAADAAPYRIDPKFFERVDWAVRQALDRGLAPVVNMHHYGEIMDRPDEHRERFLAMWRQIAEHYQDYPPALALEILNEPQNKLTAEKWNDLLAAAIAVVRRTNPTRTIVAGPASYNAIDQLDQLKLPADDRHLVVTVHYYQPFKFTHQGASWAGDEARAWLGTKWTGAAAEQQAVIRDFDRAIRWAVEHRRPLYLGEFGAYEKADIESRARWTRFIADEARRRKLGDAYWEFCSGFGAYDAKTGQWIKPLKEALLPGE